MPITDSLERYQRQLSNSLLQRSNERLNAEMLRLTSNVRIGFITALQIETDSLLAVVKALGSALTPVPRSALDVTAFYYPVEFRLPGSNEIVRGVICQCLEMGNNSASIAATCVLKDYAWVENLLMVGIAGGVPASPSEFDKLSGCSPEINDHVRLGDVVISKQGVFQYDLLKRHMGDKLEYRAVKKRLAANLKFHCDQIEENIETFEADVNSLSLRVAQRLSASRPDERSDLLQEFVFDPCSNDYVALRSFIHPSQQRRVQNTAMIHFGEIASANVLLKDPAIRDSLRSKRAVRAIEMEGSGVADAAWTFHRGYIAIRGICDYCDPNKNDDWQPYAALIAAAAAGHFVLRMYTKDDDYS